MCASSNARKKTAAGFTLAEAVAAFALWMMIAVGAGGLLRYASRASRSLAGAQEALELARVSMDALLANIQMAEKVELTTDAAGVLSRLRLHEINPGGRLVPFDFTYDQYALPSQARYRRLEFNNTELASHIMLVKLESVSPKRLDITIIAGKAAGPSIELRGSADTRHKEVTVKIT